MENSRFKFRAWDEGNKTMHKDVEFIRSGIEENDWIVFKSDKQTLKNSQVFSNPYFQQQIKLMQYTGLKDKNGVEIYEGDIVKGSAYGKEIYTGVVEFYNASFVMRIDGNKGYYRLNKMTFQELEVIGNIHENQELLGVNK